MAIRKWYQFGINRRWPARAGAVVARAGSIPAMGRRLGPLLISLVGLGAVPACDFDASGCSNFNPNSGPLAVGESTDYKVELVNNGWGVVDVDGWYWSALDTKPRLPDGKYRATATRTGEGTLVIVIDGQDPAEFEGPVTCE